MRYRSIILTLCLLWFSGMSAGAQWPMFTWSSPRSMALGGVAATGFDEPASMHLNPASLVEIERFTVSGGLASQLMSAEIDPAQSPAVSSLSAPSFAPHITGAVNFGSRLVSAGISLNSFDTFRLKLPGDAATRFQGTDLLIYSGGLDIAIGFMPIQDLSFGIKVGLMGCYADWDRRTNPFPDDPDPDFDMHWNLKMRSLTDYSVLAGIIWSPGYRLKTGLTYRPQMRYRLDTTMTVGLPDVMGGAEISSDTRALTITIPQEVRLGFHWIATERMDLFMDVAWTHAGAIDTVRLEANDPKPPYIPALTTIPIRLKDVWHGHIGLEYMVSGFLTLRAGGFYQTPSSQSGYEMVLLPRDAGWGVTAGAGFHFFEWDLDTSFGRAGYDSGRITGNELPFPLVADTEYTQYFAALSVRYHF